MSVHPTQIVHTSAGQVYTRRIQRCQSREYLRSIAPSARGIDNPSAKLDDARAMAIYLAPGKHEAIAAAFGVSRTCVGKIKSRQTWAHIHTVGAHIK